MRIRDLFRGRSPQERFARLYIQQLRKVGEARPLRFDAEAFAIRVGDDAEPAAIYHLQNAFAEFERAAPAERESILARYAIAAPSGDLPGDYAAALPRLRLLIKDRTFPEIVALQMRLDFPGKESSPGATFAHVPVAGDLLACLVDDNGPSMQFITQECVAKWNVSVERAAGDALAGMRKALACTFREIDARVHLCQAGDTYDASRILFLEEVRKLPLRGRPVALIPDRETLLIAGSSDPDALGRMALLARQRFDEGGRPVSGRPIVLGDDGWSAFTPPESLAEPFGNLARIFDSRYYHEQKQLLEALHQRSGEDVFVASSTLVQREGAGRYLSYATWSRGVPTLLPEVDEIAFYDADTGTGRMAEWSAVRRVMAERMQATDHWPPRWRVSTFPSAAELLAMGARGL